MARLFRPKFKAVDPKTGRDTLRRAKKWYADYVDAEGKRRRIPLSADKGAAQAQLAEIIRRVECQRAGLLDQFVDLLEQPVDSHVSEYQEHLEGRGRAEKHISETIRLIRKALNDCGCTVLRDLQQGEASLDEYLGKRQKEGVSHRTINADLTAMRSFCRWLIKKKRLTVDPTGQFEKLSVGRDRRKKRRSLTDEEATKLFKTTLASEVVFCGLSGRDRAMLYMLAQRSGLRRGELASLTPRSFRLDADPPMVRIESEDSKHREDDVLPLPREVAKELSAYLRGKRRSKAIWPGNWSKKSAEMFRADLSAAKIPIIDADGKILDFHGQRGTYITNLARAGVSPAMAQKLARHKDINLTMGTYTQLDVDDLAGAVESLPSLRGEEITKSGSAPDDGEISDPSLQRLVKAWPTLSSRTREAIVGILERADSSVGQKEETN